METLSTNPPSQPRGVKNILVRSSCSNEVRFDSPYQHPEAFYLLKYSPKYYKSLTLEVTCKSSLLSKAKKIKKLKRFRGLFKDSLPPKLWFDLLANNRKEIEEMPELICNQSQIRLNKAWKSLNIKNLKFFLNVRRLSQSKWKSHRMMSDSEILFYGKERCLDYLCGLRKLKSLEITVNVSNFTKVKWFLENLNGMSKLLDRLETLRIQVKMRNRNVQELFQNKNVLSHLTDLSLFAAFDPIFVEIPLMCKKLNALSLNFQNDVSERPEFLSLLASLKQLKSIELSWPGDARGFFNHFKPHNSLRCLILNFNERLFEDKSLLEGSSWEEIQELDVLGLSISSQRAEDMVFVRSFVTMVLKKICKLKTLRFVMRSHMDPSQTYEPFFVEEVPHLYESLEEFELSLYDCSRDFRKFDLKMMNPFRKLKVLRLLGNGILYDNLEGAVSLLEENQKGEDYPVLESTLYLENGRDWLRNTLKKISETKRVDRNLKILLEVNFRSRHYVDILEGMYRDFQTAKAIKGLTVHLICFNSESFPVPVEEVKEFFNRSPKIRNWKVCLDNGSETWEFIKVDGEKEQFFVVRP